MASTSEAEATPESDREPGGLAPFRRPIFRWLWTALLVSTVGSWMHETGAGWLMTSLAPDPVMVALVQAANLLPTFLLALPAGALADIVDRRRFLLFALSWLMVSAGILGILTLTGTITAWGLLAMTLAMGTGAAMMMPAFAAMIPDLVPRAELAAAVTLNGIAFNVSRAIGPVLAGLAIAAAGPGLVFTLNSISYLGVIAVLYFWRSERQPGTLPSERFFGAIRVGLRYARRSTALQVVIARGILYFVLVSAPLAFLPLIVRQEMGLGPDVYGRLLGAVGLGAVLVGLNLARIRRYTSDDQLAAVGSVGTIVATFALAFVRDPWLLAPAMLLLGASWISVLSTLQVVAQLSLPEWVRARGLAVFLASFMGTVAGASAFWGKIASLTSMSEALVYAGVTGIVGVFLGVPLSIRRYASADPTLITPVPDPNVPFTITQDQGPVLVELRYEIDPQDADDFAAAMEPVRKLRLRNGAITWGLFQDTEDERLFVELFVDESWVEHLRQHRRITRGDMEILADAYRYHRGAERPRVSHRIARQRRG
ncbi:MAG: MFS transporter [Gammaproteobacteria bacterium]